VFIEIETRVFELSDVMIFLVMSEAYLQRLKPLKQLANGIIGDIEWF